MEFTDLIKTAKADNVILWRPHSQRKITGTLCLTSHHILFSDRTSDKDELVLLYMAVEHLDRKLSGTAGILTLFCKDFTTLKLKIPGQEDAFNIAASIESLSAFESASLYYPFFLNRMSFKTEVDGWMLFKMQDEYNKMIDGSSQWKISSANGINEVCGSYPKLNIVPIAVNDDMVKRIAKFRAGGRFPVLSYLHSNKVPLMRSSQPLSGQSNKRNKDDEKLLSSVLANHTSKGQIIDTRSNSVASSHKGKGGGYESNQYYPQWIRSFQSIERPSYLGDSISSLYQACCDRKSSSWLSKLDNSGWMNYLEDVMTAVLKTAGYIHLNGAPVLVHGERGTDVTLLITALTQLILNPKCRTLLGFQSLIVREWLWGGYAFTERHLKIGISPSKRKDHAPVFIMFLDCVHQVMKQYPSSFEFTEDLLLLIAEHSYSSEYGTFLFNCEWQRDQAKVAEKTYSLWSYINREEMYKSIKNPIYEPNTCVIWPSISPQSLTVWYSLFVKSSLSKGPDAKQEIMEIIEAAKKDNIALKEKAILLKDQYEKLRVEYMTENES